MRQSLRYLLAANEPVAANALDAVEVVQGQGVGRVGHAAEVLAAELNLVHLGLLASGSPVARVGELVLDRTRVEHNKGVVGVVQVGSQLRIRIHHILGDAGEFGDSGNVLEVEGRAVVELEVVDELRAGSSRVLGSGLLDSDLAAILIVHGALRTRSGQQIWTVAAIVLALELDTVAIAVGIAATTLDLVLDDGLALSHLCALHAVLTVALGPSGRAHVGLLVLRSKTSHGALLFMSPDLFFF